MGLCAIASPTRAQDIAAAKALFTQGLSDMKAGNFAKGCPELEASYKLDPRAGALFTLAACEASWGRLATAMARYDDYLSLYGRMTAAQQQAQTERASYAKEQKAALGPLVPMLTLTLPADAPAGTAVKRDGTELTGAALGLPLPVDPGEHVVSVQAPGEAAVETRVTLRQGEKINLKLKPKPSAAETIMEKRPTVVYPTKTVTPPPIPPVASTPSPAPESEGDPSGQRVGAYVAGAFGVAGLIVGGVMGGLTLADKGVISQHCGIGGDATACDDAGLAAAAGSKTRGLVSTVGFGVGLAGVAIASVLVLTEPKRANAGLPRMQVGILGVGQGGATIGLQGVW